MKSLPGEFEYLDHCLTLGASDVHLTEDLPPRYRVSGRLCPRPDTTGTPRANLVPLLNVVVPEWEGVRRDHDASVSYKSEFFRVNVSWTNDRLAVVVRHVPQKIKPFEELGVPSAFIELLQSPSGLIIITGPTGAGKSTTLAASIHHLNTHRDGSIATFEDPIEFYHSSARCLVKQRELGLDYQSFGGVLRSLLRQDFDIAMFGEMRDPETFNAAFSAAEVGRLVLGTMHSATATDAVTRCLDAFPRADRDPVSSQLSSQLRGVLAQRLVPALNGGRLAVFELLIVTPAVANLIREQRFEHIRDEITRGQRAGMITLDASLELFFRQKRITRDVALSHAVNRPQLEHRIGIR